MKVQNAFSPFLSPVLLHIAESFFTKSAIRNRPRLMLHQRVWVNKEKKRLLMQEQADTEKQIYERARIYSADQWGLRMIDLARPVQPL